MNDKLTNIDNAIKPSNKVLQEELKQSEINATDSMLVNKERVKPKELSKE